MSKIGFLGCRFIIACTLALTLVNCGSGSSGGSNSDGGDTSQPGGTNNNGSSGGADNNDSSGGRGNNDSSDGTDNSGNGGTPSAGGEPNTGSPPVIGDGDPTFNAALVFDQQCSTCHVLGDSFLTQKKWSSIAGLAKGIAEDMPPNKPEACKDGCAEGLARYIVSNNKGIIIGDAVVDPNPTNKDSFDLSTVVPARGRVNVVPVVISRLNRNEYNNSVRDLLGTDLRPADTFPEDNFGKTFNNVSKALSLSSTHLAGC